MRLEGRRLVNQYSFNARSKVIGAVLYVSMATLHNSIRTALNKMFLFPRKINTDSTQRYRGMRPIRNLNLFLENWKLISPKIWIAWNAKRSRIRTFEHLIVLERYLSFPFGSKCHKSTA